MFAGHFWWLVREWKVQSRGSLRDFRGSARDSFAGRPSSREKHLEKFSNFRPGLFWRLDLATFWRLVSIAKIACFGHTGAVLNFCFFPSIFLWLFIVFLICSYPSHRVSIFDLHCLPLFRSKSSTNRYDISVLHSILLVVMVFPLDFSHLIVILWWVFSSTISLCPCLAYGNLCFCFWASLFWVVFVFFIMCLARVSSFLSDLLLMSCFSMILCGILLMCCWMWVLFFFLQLIMWFFLVFLYSVVQFGPFVSLIDIVWPFSSSY